MITCFHVIIIDYRNKSNDIVKFKRINKVIIKYICIIYFFNEIVK